MQFALSQATSYFVRYDINPKLMNDVMLGIKLPVPPLATQQAIAERLKSESDRLVAQQSEIGSQIGTLRELRQALITTAVTEGVEACEAVAV